MAADQGQSHPTDMNNKNKVEAVNPIRGYGIFGKQ
jgi:hypothetical protein